MGQKHGRDTNVLLYNTLYSVIRKYVQWLRGYSIFKISLLNQRRNEIRIPVGNYLFIYLCFKKSCSSSTS